MFSFCIVKIYLIITFCGKILNEGLAANTRSSLVFVFPGIVATRNDKQQLYCRLTDMS